MKTLHYFLITALLLSHHHVLAGTDADSAEITIGERLFLETRFAQAWYANPGKADPALAKTLTTGKSRKGSFAKGTMNCRACHMVDEHKDDLGMRIYADYALTSPIPDRNDGKNRTGRNSMGLVNISKPDVKNTLFHFDGEFNSLEDLVVGTFTGRNFGWQVNEKNIAIRHIANIIRTDDGKSELAKEFGGSYQKILTGTDKNIAKEFRLPVEYRVNINTASDIEILNAIAKLVTAYTADLGFSVDKKGLYNGSPYDAFLIRNKLPRSPKHGESHDSYSKRLLNKINQLKKPVFISNKQNQFETHKQTFEFTKKELKGLQLFLRKGNNRQSGGNCASCHQAPHFTDFGFHNTGISQNQYDKLHGVGEFNKIKIPTLTERNSDAARYLPASNEHPNALSIFRAVPTTQKPNHTDLGLWNIVLNTNIPEPQQKIKAILCSTQPSRCAPEMMLAKSIAAFKTPSIRDTGHSAPYMHTGELNTLKEVIAMYVSNSHLARQGHLRNTDNNMLDIRLGGDDIEPLLAFLHSLNEDYD